MSFPFDPYQGLVIIAAEMTRPAGSAVLRLALDTGATGALINAGIQTSTGIDGILGLGFLRGQTLTVDFRSGRMTLG